MARNWIGLLLVAYLLGSCRPDPPAVPAPPGFPASIVPGPGLASLSPRKRTRPTPRCAADVVLAGALPDPTHVPDREGEWIRIHNGEPWPVDLEGWHLATPHRRRSLSGLVVLGGSALTLGGSPDMGDLGSLRLRNGSGQVRLIDPCGQVTSCLAWGASGSPRLPAAMPVSSRLSWIPKRPGPARESPSGSGGGCG